ncbi:MAG: hypothetical protein HWD59_10465 [Coxiellaceae bacterium]|nr:MAG: hypothetical protein HWD59_10465 [Coxiellaceae bacterium]
MMQIASGSGSIQNISIEGHAQSINTLIQLTQEAFYYGFHKAMLLAAVLSLIGVIIMLVFQKR